jgi:hypothetical protein
VIVQPYRPATLVTHDPERKSELARELSGAWTDNSGKRNYFNGVHNKSLRHRAGIRSVAMDRLMTNFVSAIRGDL